MNKNYVTGTVPANKNYVTGTVPENKSYVTGTVPANKNYLTGTVEKKKKDNVPVNNLFQYGMLHFTTLHHV